MVQRDASICSCGQPVEAGHPPCATDVEAAQARRTRESERAEEAYRAWSQAPPSQRQLAAHHLTVASLVVAIRAEHNVSRLSVAAMLGVDAKTVKKWERGEASFPLGAVLGLEAGMAVDLLSRVAALRGVSLGLGAEIARLRRTRDLDAIHAAQDALTALEREIVRGR